MVKYGIIFDSNCGISKKQVENDGNFFIPININIDQKKYRAGEEIFAKDLYEIMKNKKIKISTSSAMGEDIKKTFKKGLEKFDELIFIGMSYKFSATQENVRMIANQYDEFKNKIHIYKSLYSSPWTFLFYKDIIEIIENETSKEEIFKKLDFQNDKMIGWLSPARIYWLYKGGRISREQYIAGNFLKIKPILTIKNGEIEKKNVVKVRTIRRGLEKMYQFCQPLKKLAIKNNYQYQYVVIYAGNKKLLEQSISIILENEIELKKEDIITTEISPEQIVHMGPEAFGMSIKINFPKKGEKK